MSKRMLRAEASGRGVGVGDQSPVLGEDQKGLLGGWKEGAGGGGAREREDRGGRRGDSRGNPAVARLSRSNHGESTWHPPLLLLHGAGSVASDPSTLQRLVMRDRVTC